MVGWKQYLDRRLTPTQAVVAVVILAVVGGLGYACYLFIAAQVFEARVRAATPRLCAAIRQQRETLEKAIEAYKTSFGVYPPDHVLSRQPLVVDPVTNTLLYELAGATVNPTNKLLSVTSLEPANADYVKAFFHVDRFRNCAERADQVKRFLPVGPTAAKQLHDDPDVFILRADFPFGDIDPEVFWRIDFGSWRYVSSGPTNNPGRFDLWIEAGVADHKITIGNWKAVE